MNVLYCGDANIKDGLLLSALSLKNHVDKPLHLYILTMSLDYKDKSYKPIEPEFVAYLESLLKKKNEASTCKLYNLHDLFIKEMPHDNMDTRFTPYCMLRLFADELDLPKKILYLDTDVLCRKNPEDFYEQDMEGVEFAGVLDYIGRWFFHQKPFHMDYCNSGVLLLNLEEIKKTNLFKTARDWCIHKQMFMPDQSSLNKLVTSKKIWPRRYNEQRKLHNDTVFQHFTTGFRFFPYFHMVSVKPWQIDEVHNILHLKDYDFLFQEYEKAKEEYENQLQKGIRTL